MTVVEHKETRSFQAEVRQILDLMIHSLYSNKEIFLRELVSNGSDACDKLRFEALGNDGVYENAPDLRLRITFDKEARTVTVSDNGIGMSREEVVTHIGTIAKSGTREFFNALTGDQSKDMNLIGQFGVGLYSAFIVADKVTIRTRRAGLAAEEGVAWESDGQGEYTLATIERPERGTDVILHLRAEEDDFLNDWRLRSIIRKFSDHVAWPIEMLAHSHGEEGEEESAAAKWERVNKASALWSRAKSDVSEEEYREFYKHVGHDFDDPLSWLHVKLEGKYEYTLLLYLPKHAPFDIWDRETRHGVKLYVRRVFIMENAEELMPRYLRFVRGIVDSSDLPLNVSREILQQNKAVEAIRKGAVGKVLGLLEEMAENDAEKYAGFWKEFGRVLKEGLLEDHANQEKLARLMRFASTVEGGADKQPVALAAYVGRMKEGQEKIYYLTGESFAAAAGSPHLEIFRKKGIEVLLLTDRIDEWVISHLTEFEGKNLAAVTKGALDLGKLADAQDEEALKEEEKTFSPLIDRVKAALGETVKEVRVSHRLTDSPACLVGDEHDLSPAMERLLKSAGQSVPEAKRILELNPGHALVKRLEGEHDGARFTDWCHVLHDQALLGEGGQLEEPQLFVQRLNRLLQAS